MSILSTTDPTLLVVVVTGAATLVVVAVMSRMLSHDPREPPLAKSSIPIVGHMVGMATRKFDYYLDLWYVQRRRLVTT